MTQQLGFIGLGKMGAPMAGRLLEAGHALIVYDVSEAAMRSLVEQGATAARSAAEVASAAETVLVSLPTPDIVRRVALDEAGVIAGSRVRTFIDLSTTGPRMAVAIAEGLAAKGIATVDAPVSGGTAGAREGTLAVMASCPMPVFQQVEPVLKSLGRVFHVGEKPGLGQMMKLANNLVSAAAMAISCEAVVMGVKAGLDPQVMVDVINVSSGANAAMRDKFPKSVLPRTFDFGFATGLMYKDVRLALEEAEALGVPMWVGSAVHQLWLLANTQLGSESDFTALIQCIEQWAGVEVRGGTPLSGELAEGSPVRQ